MELETEYTNKVDEMGNFYRVTTTEKKIKIISYAKQNLKSQTCIALNQPIIFMGESVDLHFPLENVPSQMLGSITLAEHGESLVPSFSSPLSTPTPHP